MLKIHGLKKKFGNFEALRGLDMEVEEGALYGFVGPNGAGKDHGHQDHGGAFKAGRGIGGDLRKGRFKVPGGGKGSVLAMCPMSLACMTI